MAVSSEDPLAVLAEDVDAYFELLVPRYWHQLKAFVLPKIGNAQDAEDIVQEAFVRVYFALERYSVQQRQTLKVRPWLYKITWNVYCNYATRYKSPQLSPFDISDESELREMEAMREELPDMVYEREESRQELEALVATLPQHYRVIVSLYFFRGFSHQEIAHLLKQPVGTVKVYAHRGVRLLRKMLTVQVHEVR